MPYQLVLSEREESATRDVGENVFLDQLPSDYPIYLFYYPSAMPNEDLETALRRLGEITGQNLFVNIGRLNDPRYRDIARRFKIKPLPVIIMTGIDKLASPPEDFFTAFVRIDSKGLLASPDLTVQCLQKMYNLFIEGRISETMKEFKKDRRDVVIIRLKGILSNALKGLWDLVKDLDVSFSIIDGKFEVKRFGG
jgi:hypothetical protein